MKHFRFSLFALFVLASFNILKAQNFRFGVHLTPGVNFLTTDQPGADAGSSFYFSYGGLMEYRFAENYAFATGFEVSQRGGTLELNDTIGDYRSGFLQFPLLLRMRTREFGYFTYNAEFGLVPAFRTSDRSDFDPVIPEAERLENYVEFFNTLFRFGIGAEYSLGGSTALFVNLNYNRSLINNLNDDDSRLRNRYSYRFDYVALTLGFIF